MGEWEDYALKKINDRRGWLKPLALDFKESDACRHHANYLIRLGRLEHASDESLGGWAENLGQALHYTNVERAALDEVKGIIDALVEEMMSTPASRDNMKNAKEKVAIGFSALGNRIVMVTRFK